MFDIDRLGVRVYGYAFTSAAMTESPLASAERVDDNGYTKIFCGHAELNAPLSRYAPVMLSELEDFGFEYAALGHVHNVKAFEDIEGRVRYSGFAEGRAFDELGEGGVWIVDLSDGKCECERKTLSNKAFYISELELSAEDQSADMENKIGELVKKEGWGASSYIRIALSGIADENELAALIKKSGELGEALGVAYIELIDETMPLLDVDYLERDTSLRGELYRVLRPKLMSADRTERVRALQALKIGLSAIDGKNIFGAIN